MRIKELGLRNVTLDDDDLGPTNEIVVLALVEAGATSAAEAESTPPDATRGKGASAGATDGIVAGITAGSPPVGDRSCAQ